MSQSANTTLTSDDDKNAIYKRITLRLIPFIFICYLFNYLDRVNVGFAKLQMLDALKFSETVYGLGAGIFFIGYVLCGVPNQLAQLLYNVPPLYHLSEATLATRLKSIQRQDAFFRPLHERLATQAMTGFSWLTDDRQVQQTTFTDGTRLVANFDEKRREVGFQAYKAHSVTVLEVGGSTLVFQP